MNRIAVLIGSPGKDLNGVPNDIENVKSYLKSAEGGGWSGSEIKEPSRLNPSAKEVMDLLKLIDTADFAFVYYSGHGDTGSDGGGRLKVNLSEHIKVVDVANRCRKQITIIDACRTFSNNSSFSGISEKYTISFNYNNIGGSKQIFNSYLNYCKDGRVLIYAASKGEYSYDSDAGGIFSICILEAAKQLTTTSKNPIINIHSIFIKAKEWAQSHQNPMIDYTINEALNFPFAIKPQKSDDRKIKKAAEDNASGILGAVAIVGLAVLVGALLSSGNNKK